MKKLELKIPPVAVCIIFIVIMSLVAQVMPLAIWVFPWQDLVAIVLVLLGIVAAVSGVAHFRKAETTVNPIKPESASTIVSTGIYGISRNPMYLGMLLVLLGYAVNLAALSSYLTLGLFVVYMNQFQIKPEERHLEQKFGADYSDYKNKVRRWL